MAEDDLKSEQFIREVDEEFRRAQIKGIWDRFAPLIVAVCLLVVLGTAGYRGWLWWQARQAAAAGDVYMDATEKLGTGASAEGEATLSRLAAEGGGYGALARMRLAGAKVASGDKSGAVAEFDGIAGDTSVSADFRDLSRLRAGLLALDLGDLAGARTRVEGLAVPGNPWRHAAREVLGTAAFASGDTAAARSSFEAIQADAEAPQDLRSRAELMMNLIEAQGTATPAPAAAAPIPASPDAAPAANAVPSADAASPDAAAPAPDEPAADFAEPATIPGLVSPADGTTPDTAAAPGLAPDATPSPSPAATPSAPVPPDTAPPAAADTAAPATIPTPAAGSAEPAADSPSAPAAAPSTEASPPAPSSGAASQPALP